MAYSTRGQSRPPAAAAASAPSSVVQAIPECSRQGRDPSREGRGAAARDPQVAQRRPEVDLGAFGWSYGRSSVGRAAVSKTAGPRFEPWRPCHPPVGKGSLQVAGFTPAADSLLPEWRNGIRARLKIACPLDLW